MTNNIPRQLAIENKSLTVSMIIVFFCLTFFYFVLYIIRFLYKKSIGISLFIFVIFVWIEKKTEIFTIELLGNNIYFGINTLMYVPLHGHSTFSFLEALGHPKDVIQRAKELGFPAIAITDYNGMFGIPAFFQASKDSKNPDDENDQGVKSIFGTEIGFVMDINASLIGKNIGNICMIAETDKGYHNMMELVAFANQQGYSNGIPKVDVNALKEKSEGIIIFAGGEQSWMSRLVSSGESEMRIREVYEMLQDIFGENCYLEITAQDEEVLSITKKSNQFVYNLAKKTNTKLIVNNDFRYLREGDKHTREIALAIKDGAKMYDLNRRRPAGKYHIMDGEEIKNICLKNGYDEKEIDEWIENNWNIANKANASMLLNQKLFPRYNVPDHIKALYDKYGAGAIIEE